MTPEDKLADLGYPIRLPPKGEPRPYAPLIQVGNIVYGSGNTSQDRHSGEVFAGRLGEDIDIETGRERARLALVNALAALKVHLGSLSRVKQVVRLTGYVNGSSDFIQQPEVMNGASELLLAAFGDRGRHARSALGVPQLPAGATIEVELIVMVET